MARFVISKTYPIEPSILGQRVPAKIILDGYEQNAELVCIEMRHVPPELTHFPEGSIVKKEGHYEYHFLSVGEF